MIQVVNFASPSHLEQSHTIDEMHLKVVSGGPKGKAQLLMARLVDKPANSQALMSVNRPRTREEKPMLQNGTTKSGNGQDKDGKVLLYWPKREKPCLPQRCRPACTCTQSDQHMRAV